MPDSEEPQVTLPITYLRELMMGYKYTSYDGKEADNLRDKCVPRIEVVEILRKVPGHEKYIHIQDTGKDTLPLVWHIKEWRDSGERKVERNEVLEKEKELAEKLFLIIRTKIPRGIDGNALKALALEWVRTKPDLSMYGVDWNTL